MTTYSYQLLGALSLILCGNPRAQEGDSFFRSGDMRRVQWVRPWAQASAAAKKSGRLLLVKPILGGSNKPDPDGIPCGGKEDCEGSW